MATEIRIEGDPAAQLRKLARDLKMAGAVDLRRELFRNLQVAAQPMIQAAKESAASNLPHGGGRGARHYTRSGKRGALKTSGRAGRSTGGSRAVESVAQRVSGASYQVKTSGAGNNYGLVLKAKEKSGKAINLNALDNGRLRHPLYGNRSYWYQQQVAPGWWTKPMQQRVPLVTAAVTAAVDEMARKFNEGLF